MDLKSRLSLKSTDRRAIPAPYPLLSLSIHQITKERGSSVDAISKRQDRFRDAEPMAAATRHRDHP
jgi:hypothetical protein